MRFAQHHSSTHGSWSYQGKSGQNTGYLLSCRYVHTNQMASLSKMAEFASEKFNYTYTCSYEDLMNQDGKYAIFKTNVEREFSKKTFEELINYIKPAYLKPPVQKEDGHDTSPDDLNDEPINKSIVDKGINEKNVPPKKETPYSKKPSREYNPIKSRIQKLNYNSTKDYTKTGDSLQSFTWQSLKNANFNKIPTFTKAIIYPFAGLMLIIGIPSLINAILQLHPIMIFVGFVNIGIALLLLFGIADYWTRKTARYEDDSISMVNGKDLFVALEEKLGTGLHNAKAPEHTLKDTYTRLLNSKDIHREYLYMGKDFIVGYCELLYETGTGSKSHSSYRSCFALKLDIDVEKKVTSGKRIVPWIFENTNIELNKFLNTNGFTLIAEGNYILFLFRETLYRSDYIYEIMIAIVAAAESNQRN